MIDLGGGKRFTVRATNLSSKNFYIQSVTLNGAPYDKTYLRHADIVKGGELTFAMGPEPNQKWGTGPHERPLLHDTVVVRG